mmetsp:Transcript_56057/g.126360  ORF Transcript_56057/g.126360 Transcript_56057/m.126360 type:complete len:220 (+) Transcript_56057:1403-2062(+)
MRVAHHRQHPHPRVYHNELRGDHVQQVVRKPVQVVLRHSQWLRALLHGRIVLRCNLRGRLHRHGERDLRWRHARVHLQWLLFQQRHERRGAWRAVGAGVRLRCTLGARPDVRACVRQGVGAGSMRPPHDLMTGSTDRVRLCDHVCRATQLFQRSTDIQWCRSRPLLPICTKKSGGDTNMLENVGPEPKGVACSARRTCLCLGDRRRKILSSPTASLLQF